MFEEKTINLVISQTNYDRDISIQKLEFWNGDYIKVIKEYLNPNFQKKNDKKKLTTNQQIMTSIRTFMDDVQRGYNERKKKGEEYKKNKEMEIRKKETLKKKLEFINEINEEEEENIIITEVIDSN
jgi:hypothetical protein